MALTRTSSGLLERDEFSSDTSGNYNKESGASMTVSGGKATGTNNKPQTRKTLMPVVVTVKSERRTGSRAAGAWISPGSALDPIANADGYSCQLSSTPAWQVIKWTDGNDAVINPTSTTDMPASTGNPCYIRLWRDATNVYGRVGTATLGNLMTRADTTFAGGYGGITFANETSYIDWVEYRTSVNITCSGIPAGGYFKVTDGTTTAKASASAGTATVNAQALLFPLTYVYVYDGDPDAGGNLLATVAAATYADMGGGDVFAYAPAASFIHSIMRPHIIPSIGGQ